MSLIKERRSARHLYLFRPLLNACILLSLCAVAFAQGGVGSSRGLPSTSDGNNIIQGRVFFPSEPKEGKRVKVRLTSADFVDQAISTDGDGAFSFNRLPAGHYTIVAEGGKEFDSASESVSIDREASVGGRTMTVTLTLRPKGTADAAAKIPKAARELYTKAHEAAGKGDSKKAIEQFNGAVALYPEFPQALHEMGVQYLKLGQADKAVESFLAALKYAPNDSSLRLNYGVALLNQNEFAEAEAQFREVIVKNDKLPTAHMYLGVSLAKQNKLDEAVTELQQAIKLGGNELSRAHYFLGGVYWQRSDFPHAADELETYLKLSPNDPNAEKLRATIKDWRSKK